MNGCEWVIEAHGCDPALLADKPRLEELFQTLVDGMQLHPVHPGLWHVFPAPGGITGLLLLSESHVTCHTFPEFQSICLNVFCCRTRPEYDFVSALERLLGAERVTVRRLERPYSQ